MPDKKSSYFGLFRYSVILVLSVLIIIGVIMVSICSEVYKKEKLNNLKETGELFVNCLKDDYDNAGRRFTSSLTKMKRRFEDEYGIKIYVYNADGVDALSENPALNEGDRLKPEQMKRLDKSDFLDIDVYNYSSSEPALLYATQFTLKKNDPDSRTIDAYIPVKTYARFYGPTDQITAFTLKLTLLYILFAALGLAAVAVIQYRRIRTDMKYESELMRICEQYSKSNFTEKLSTDMPGNLKDIATYINVVASNVESSDDTSKTFIANVSHELRTPMTTIGGFVDGILDGTIKKSQQNEYLILVSKEIKRLRILISSMLNMTRFESGTLTPNYRETNLTDLVIQTVLMFEKKIEAKELEVEGLDSEKLVATVDADLMQQVIYNLVENAVKFIDKGGTLSFRFEQEDLTRIIAIRNTGEGLQSNEIQQVFDRFYKTDSSRGKDTTGLGLGLSISRKIVHLHNGHIVVKSVYGEYTEFQIRIPEDPRLNIKV
ncbi:MAG: HAMP domain-containing histidine kinase [Ruminococcus sp.]|nr:HAMP domain-containing histidine kinase [Ruminococcus sp.]